MNTFYQYILRVAVALSLCAGVVSCAQDELVIGSEDMPSGDHPLKLTASVDGMRTRAEDPCSWVDGDGIAVRIGEIGRFDRIGHYLLNADGTVMDEVYPLNWPRPKDIVKAWYPYVDMNTVKTYSLKDQSNGYHDIDFMRAESGDSIHYREVVDLKFKHQMAKVSTVLVRGEGVSEEEFATARVYYSGCTSADFSETALTGDNIGLITPDSVNTALLVPREMTGEPLIVVKLTVNVNGNLIDKTLTYTPANNADDLIAGYHNHYTVTVQKDRLKVNPPITASWNDDREPGSSQPWIFKVLFAENQNIPNSRRKDIVFSENVVNGEAYKDGKDDHLEVAGNEFSISCLIPDEDITLDVRLRDYNADKDSYEYSTETVNDGTKYTFNFRFRSNGMTIVYREIGRLPQVGDFYYQDGTWSSSLKDNKTCIGIVIYTIDYDRSDEQDMRNKLAALNDFYAYDFSKFKDGVVHGYVLAIKDAADACAWSNSTTKSFGVSLKGTNVNDFSGCANTAKVFGLLADDPEYKNIEVPAFKACRDFENVVPASPSSSGWYLPSYSHFNVIRSNSIVKNRLKTVSEADYNKLTSSNYWTSSEQAGSPNRQAWCMRSFSSMLGTNSKTTKNGVRAVLTF